MRRFLAAAFLLSACARRTTERPAESVPASRPAPVVRAEAIPADLLRAEDSRDLAAALGHVASPDPLVRARAARALGRIGGADELVAPLDRLVRDADPRVAIEALFAAGLAGVSGAVAGVATRAGDGDPAIRAGAIEALGRSGDDRLAPACAARLEDPDPAVRREAALAVFRLAGDRFTGTRTLDGESVVTLVGRLAAVAAAEKDDEARWAEVYALANLRLSDAVGPLVRASADARPLIRLFAVRGLGRQEGNGRALAAIVERIGDADDAVATEAAIAAARHRSNDARPALVRLLDRDCAVARRAAARALGATVGATPEVLAALGRVEADRSPWVRAEAAPAFASLASADASTRIARALGDADPLVRARAIEALALGKAAAAVPHLDHALRDGAARVAAAAATALGKLDGADLGGRLREALGHPSGLVRESAASAMEEVWKRARAVPIDDLAAIARSLESARGADFAEPRSVLLESLAKGLAFPASAPLEGKLAGDLDAIVRAGCGDPDPSVRAKARLAWTRLHADAPVPIDEPAPRAPTPIPGADVPGFRRDPRVRFDTTRGEFDAVLFASDAPVHAENCLRLARGGHYAETPFHRVEPNFVVQGGDHVGDGTGGRAAWGGTLRDEIQRRRFVRGTIGMPKTDTPDSGGCQIFVTLVPTPHLDGRYTAFGQVERGMEVVDAIEPGDRIRAVRILDDGR